MMQASARISNSTASSHFNFSLDKNTESNDPDSRSLLNKTHTSKNKLAASTRSLKKNATEMFAPPIIRKKSIVVEKDYDTVQESAEEKKETKQST